MENKIKKIADTISQQIANQEQSQNSIIDTLKQRYLLPDGRVAKHCCISGWDSNDLPEPLTYEKFLQLSNDQITITNCDECKLLLDKYPQGGHDYDEEKKHYKQNLHCLTTHSLGFLDNGSRIKGKGLLNDEAFIDIDKWQREENIREFLTRILTPDFCQKYDIRSANISPSGIGAHVVFGRGYMEGIATAQRRMAAVLGLSEDEYDKKVFEDNRLRTIVPLNHYIVLPKEEDFYFSSWNEAWQCAQQSAKLNQSEKTVKKAAQNLITPDQNNNNQNNNTQYQGATYTNIVKCLIQALGGTPKEGDRHNMYGTLVGYLRNICNNDPKLIYDILPKWNSEEEQYRQCCDICKYENDGNILRVVRQAVKTAKELTKQQIYNSQSLPLPPLNHLQKLILSRIPKQYHEQYLLIETAIVGTLLHNCSCTWVNGEERHFGFGTVLVGHPASGKSFYKQALELLKYPVYLHDKEAKQLQDEYKQNLKLAKNTGKQPIDPQVHLVDIVIDTTLPKLAYYIQNADGDTLFAHCDEIDELTRTETKNSTKKVLLRFSWDGSKWGQDRVGADSITANGYVKINTLINSTPGGFYRFYDQKEVEDGLASRHVFAIMPEFDLFAIPKFEPYSNSQKLEIQQIASELYATTGHFYCPLVNQVLTEWLQDKKLEYADKNQYYMQYVIRAAENACRAANAYAIVNGSARRSQVKPKTYTKGEKDAANYAIWYAENTLRNAMFLFDDKIAKLQFDMANFSYSTKYSPTRLYQDLDSHFTKNDIKQLQDENNYHPKKLSTITSRWRKDGLIIDNPDGSFTKVK